MTPEIIVAIITGLCSVLAVYLTSQKSARDVDAKLEKQQAVFEAIVTERINALTEKVERHNTVIERTYRLEEKTALLEAEIKRGNDR